VQAVAGATLDVKRGEIFGLVGESGSGKSTLAKCVSGLIDPTGGSIEFDGVAVSPQAFRRNHELPMKLQMVFQNPDNALNPRHTVRFILMRSIRVLRGVRSRVERRQGAVDLARTVRLAPRHLASRPAALSGGLKQRVAIARAFSGTPSMVVCDEPVSALDVSVQAAILNLLLRLQAEKGVSYIFISHDLAVVHYLADRIGVMYLGELVDVGPAEAVFNPPHHPYTEALLSAIPTLDFEGRKRRVKLEGTMPNPSNPPSGCRFHTRCPRFLGPSCADQAPPWQEDHSGNRYRCHIPSDRLREMQAPEVSPATLTRPEEGANEGTSPRGVPTG
jgi:peptide/nickel transport system ATP-binding protein